MARVVYGNLVKSIHGNFGSSNGYTRFGQTILRRRRGTVSGETPNQRLQRNAARYIGMALTTGTPHLRSAWPLIQSGRPENWRKEKRYRDSSWFANMYAAFRRSLNKDAIRTETRGDFGIGFRRQLTTHKPPVLNHYITWTGRGSPEEVALKLIYTQWSQSGKWEFTNLSNLQFNQGNYTLSLLPNCVTLITQFAGAPELSNFGEAIVFLNNIQLANQPTL